MSFIRLKLALELLMGPDIGGAWESSAEELIDTAKDAILVPRIAGQYRVRHWNRIGAYLLEHGCQEDIGNSRFRVLVCSDDSKPEFMAQLEGDPAGEHRWEVVYSAVADRPVGSTLRLH